MRAQSRRTRRSWVSPLSSSCRTVKREGREGSGIWGSHRKKGRKEGDENGSNTYSKRLRGETAWLKSSTELRRDALLWNILTFDRIEKNNKNLYTSAQLIYRCKAIFLHQWVGIGRITKPTRVRVRPRRTAEMRRAERQAMYVIDLILRFSVGQTDNNNEPDEWREAS